MDGDRCTVRAETIGWRRRECTRHPQYSGIMLAVLGENIHWPTIPTLVLFSIIIGLYMRLARREERPLIERFKHGCSTTTLSIA